MLQFSFVLTFRALNIGNKFGVNAKATSKSETDLSTSKNPAFLDGTTNYAKDLSSPSAKNPDPSAHNWANKISMKKHKQTKSEVDTQCKSYNSFFKQMGRTMIPIIMIQNYFVTK